MTCAADAGSSSSPAAGREADASLIDALRRGDDAAYERLVRENAPRLLAVIRRLVVDEDDARDVLQETFVSAWKAIRQFHGESRLSTWLHRIAVNAALMRLRSKKSRPERPIDDLLPKFDDDGHHVEPPAAWDGRAETRLEDEETRQRVLKAIETLPETYRTVLVLRDVEGLPTEEVASILNVTPNAVKVRLHRAHMALRSLLDPHFRPPPKNDSRRGNPTHGRPIP